MYKFTPRRRIKLSTSLSLSLSFYTQSCVTPPLLHRFTSLPPSPRISPSLTHSLTHTSLSILSSPPEAVNGRQLLVFRSAQSEWRLSRAHGHTGCDLLASCKVLEEE